MGPPQETWTQVTRASKRASLLRVLKEAFLREQQPYSHGIREVKASHWLRESGKLNIHLVNTPIVALPVWLLS